MTLCVAWLKNGVPTFASDSRLTLTGANAPPPIDAFVKITSIQCVLYPPGGSGVDQPTAVMPIACLFAGSALNAYAVKEHLGAFLQRLQFVPGYSEPSAELVFELAKSVFKKVATKFRYSLMMNAAVKLLLVARCPVHGTIQSIEMSWAGDFEPAFKSIALSDHPSGYFFGSQTAVDHAHVLSRQGIDPLSTLLKTIQDHVDPAVGGEMQVAELQHDGLRMIGVTLLGPEHTAKWCGIDFEDGIRESDGLSLVPSYTTLILS